MQIVLSWQDQAWRYRDLCDESFGTAEGQLADRLYNFLHPEYPCESP